MPSLIFFVVLGKLVMIEAWISTRFALNIPFVVLAYLLWTLCGFCVENRISWLSVVKSSCLCCSLVSAIRSLIACSVMGRPRKARKCLEDASP